ncbi:MAG TPA: serine/threonine-protein kinase, partial [Kofleriaceae bacterium]
MNGATGSDIFRSQVVANLDRLGLIGQTVDGRYTIVEQVGEGGMGAVYRAQHKRLGRQVAIKFLHHEFARDHEALDRFFNEARAAATLGHPNIAESFDMGELADGSPFIVLELLKGRSIHDEIVRNGKLSIRRALRIARQIALGLDAVHQRGIIHRDLKAENVYLTEREDNPDHVKILDFGVARILENPTNVTKPGHLIGTPEIMPPEQIIAPDTVDARVDVYATGVILYQMLSGQKPYGSLPLAALLHRIIEESPAPLTFLPDEVRRLVEDAMARDRGLRIQTMTELRDRIDVCIAAITSPATPLRTRLPTGIGAASHEATETAIAENTAPFPLAAPTPTVSQRRDVPGRHRSLVIRAVTATSALALAGVAFAVFHGTGSPPSAPLPSPPPPAQVATAPVAAPAVSDPPST